MKIPALRITTALLCLSALAAGCGQGPAPGPDYDETRALQTPAEQGSMAPNLVRGADGSVVLSWIEPEGDQDALRFSVFEDNAWSPVRTVVTGDNWFANWADFPSVVPISDTLWGAHWLARREAGGYAYDIYAAISNDAGRTWSEPFNPHSDDTDTEHGFVSMFPDRDGIGMLWLDGRKFVNDYDVTDVTASGMTLRAATIGADLSRSNETLVDDLICDCCQTDVTLTSRGPVGVYRNRSVEEIRDIHITRLVDGAWQAGIPVASDDWEIPGCPVNGPIVQADGEDLAVAWFSAANQLPKVQVAWSSDAGKTMSDPVRVADGSLLGHVGAVMLSSGDMAVTWLGNAGGGKAALHLRRVSSSGEHGPDQVLAEAAGVAAFSVPQVVLIGEKLLVAWTDASGEHRFVKTALVPLQFLN